MGKALHSRQNGKVPPDFPRAVRLRPEEILAQTLTIALPAETTDGWSPKGRRLFLAALAVAGVLLVVTGLVLTGELGPGPGRPQPVATGPDAGGLGSGLLGPIATPAGGPPISTATPPSTIRTAAPAVTPATRPAPGAVETPTTQATRPAPPPPPPPSGSPTSTTLPCNLLGAQGLSAPVPPLCR
jgi:hypothetical protein